MARFVQHLLPGSCALAVALSLACAGPASVAAQERPDLVVRELSEPPASALPGQSFVVTARVRNRGLGPMDASTTTRFFLVNTTDSKRKNLKGEQTVPPLGAGLGFASATTLAIFSDTLPGTYRFLACADGPEDQPETIETNNCRESLGTIVVEQTADLTVSGLSAPPAAVSQGQPYRLRVTVTNESTVPAIATTVKFYLVSEADGTRKDMKGTLDVPALGPGESFTQARRVWVRAETSPGLYRQQACADSGKVVLERDENDNCRTRPSLVQVTPKPDLLVTSVTVAGPLTVGRGAPLSISADVANQGQGAAAASTIKYWLVPLPQGAGERKNLNGAQAVPDLGQGGTMVVTAVVKVFSDTAFGDYNVQACVDPDEVLAEGSDSNNCETSTETVTVANVAPPRPDLVVTALTEPPASILPRGTFQVTATVKNEGPAQSAASTTRFYLRSTAEPPPPRKNLNGEQSVALLGAGAAASSSVMVEVFSDTAAGTYVLEACADGGGDVPEVDDQNNCRNSAGTVTVAAMPDLVITTLSSPPASSGTGQSFAVTSTVQNVGDVAAPPSRTKYYLRSTGPVSPPPRHDLKGVQQAPALEALQTFTEAVDVTVLPGTGSGTYELQACADSGKVIVEEDEDNCLVAPGTVQIQATALPDLAVTTVRVKDAPVTVAPGGTVVIRAFVANAGAGDAGPTTMRYWLVPVDGGPLKNLTGTKPVPAVLAGATSEPIRKQVTLFSDTPPGTYKVQACADAGEVLVEITTENNCKVSNGTVIVQ